MQQENKRLCVDGSEAAADAVPVGPDLAVLKRWRTERIGGLLRRLREIEEVREELRFVDTPTPVTIEWLDARYDEVMETLARISPGGVLQTTYTGQGRVRFVWHEAEALRPTWFATGGEELLPTPRLHTKRPSYGAAFAAMAAEPLTTCYILFKSAAHGLLWPVLLVWPFAAALVAPVVVGIRRGLPSLLTAVVALYLLKKLIDDMGWQNYVTESWALLEFYLAEFDQTYMSRQPRDNRADRLLYGYELKHWVVWMPRLLEYMEQTLQVRPASLIVWWRNLYCALAIVITIVRHVEHFRDVAAFVPYEAPGGRMTTIVLSPETVRYEKLSSGVNRILFETPHGFIDISSVAHFHYSNPMQQLLGYKPEAAIQGSDVVGVQVVPSHTVAFADDSDGHVIAHGFRVGAFIVTAEHAWNEFRGATSPVIVTNKYKAQVDLAQWNVGPMCKRGDFVAIKPPMGWFELAGVRSARIGATIPNRAMITRYGPAYRRLSASGKVSPTADKERWWQASHFISTAPGVSGCPIVMVDNPGVVVGMHTGSQTEMIGAAVQVSNTYVPSGILADLLGVGRLETDTGISGQPRIVRARREDYDDEFEPDSMLLIENEGVISAAGRGKHGKLLTLLSEVQGLSWDEIEGIRDERRAARYQKEAQPGDGAEVETAQSALDYDGPEARAQALLVEMRSMIAKMDFQRETKVPVSPPGPESSKPKRVPQNVASACALSDDDETSTTTPTSDGAAKKKRNRKSKSKDPKISTQPSSGEAKAEPSLAQNPKSGKGSSKKQNSTSQNSKATTGPTGMPGPRAAPS